MLASFATDEVTIIRAPLTVDEYGTPGAARDWDNADESVAGGCSVQPAGGSEYLDGRNAVTTRWTLWAPAGTDLLATDRVRHAGAVYEVDGEVMAWSSPTGALSHVQAVLMRVRG